MEAEWAVDVASLNLDQHSIDFCIKQERAGEVEQRGRRWRQKFVSPKCVIQPPISH